MIYRILMFCEHPEKFFPYTQVDIVKVPEGSVKNPNNFVEIPSIKGSVPMIINRTMEKLQDMVIEELVTKVDYQMEAIRRFSYPYQALEEAVVNAFYHRDYMCYEPVHIEIEPECINIISFPGPDRSISKAAIEAGERFATRVYRNRRLGEFLKALELAEGHSTGIPTIQDELEANGSPRARFYTDDDRRAIRVEIPIHMDFVNVEKGAEKGVKKAKSIVVAERTEEIYNLIKAKPEITRNEIMEMMKLTRKPVADAMSKLVESGRIQRMGSDRKGYWKIINVKEDDK